jgi:uncharacterized protein
MRASGQGQLECTAVLLEAGVPLDPADNGGWTAALCAAEQGHTGVLRLLLAAGANILDEKLLDGRDARALAAADSHADTLSFLLALQKKDS